MNQIIMGYIIPAIIALFACFGVFKVVKAKISEVHSLTELVNFFLTDETILQILNSNIAEMELGITHYDKFEDFLLEYKSKIIISFKEYLKSKHVPDSILKFINDENLKKAIDIIMDKTNIETELNKIFDKSIEAELAENENIEEIKDADDTEATTDTEPQDEVKEDTTDLDLNKFYED